MYLKENCYLVEGYKNAAIYDLDNCKVYSLNENAKNIIKKYLDNSDVEISEEDKNFMEKLRDINLIEYKKNKSKIVLEEQKPCIKYAWLEITSNCNLKCIHCYGKFGDVKNSAKGVLSTNDWKEIIDKLLINKCKEIQLIGGEPMIHKDFYELLKYAHDKGMERIDFFTNATLINQESIEVFKKTNASVRVSLYGHNKELHEKITKIKGSFEKTEKALKLLKKSNIRTKIAVVIMRENEKYISEIKKYINSLGHEYTGYDVIRPSCVLDSKEHSVSNINILKSRYNVRPKFWINKESFMENHYYNSCWNGKVAITANGDIIPCIFARDDVAGNIKKDTVEYIKENIIKKWKITKDDVEECKNCEFRYCCHDCRPLAKGILGDIYAKYPRCCYNPYTGEWMDIKDVTKELKI